MNVLQRLSEITEIPTLPEVLIKVQSLVNSDDGNARLLSKIIEQDPALSAKVLKIANSAFFNPVSQRVSSLHLAIARIGFTEIRNITMAITVIKQLSKKSNLLDYKLFWRHCLSAAYLTQIIASKLPQKISPEEKQICFIAGLLHDIGILMYDQFFHKEFENIMEYALKREDSFIAAEQAIAGKETHQMVGSALLELWKMDSAVISGVRYHHTFERAPSHHNLVVAVITLTEYILCNCALGSFEGTIGELNGNLWEILKISPELLGELFSRAEEQVEQADLILAMEADDKTSQLRLI